MAITMSGASTVVAVKAQVSCDVLEEVAVLNLTNGVYYGLNPVGARIWNLIQQPRTVREIVDTVMKEYDVAHEQCERDLLLLLERMAAEGLIEVVEEQASRRA